MEELLKQLIEIVEPLTEDKTINDSERNVIIAGYEILIDHKRELKDKIQLACDQFDIAQYMPYNPFHSRATLAKAIATHEVFFDKEFERTSDAERQN